MGIFHELFQELFGSEPASNPAEEQAKSDHDWERYISDRDPIPTEPPEWAKDISTPDPSK